MEVWKDVKEYEGLYKVSNLGRVKSLERIKFSYGFFRKQNERILKPGIGKKGYLTCVLYKNTHRKTIKVHQLVAIAFLNHIPCGMELVVDHINDIKTDNRVENLQIITNRENSYRTQGKHTSKYKGVFWDKSRSKWRAEIRINNKNNYLGRFDIEEEASEAYQNKLKEII